jgi:hypothetical protein
LSSAASAFPFPGEPSVPAATADLSGIQFGRLANLIVANAKLGTARDISELHFTFKVIQCDNDTPNTMVVRIYNLSAETQSLILTQFEQIALQVGYEGTGLDMIFSGDIKYFRKGKENATDRFLEITAADNDLGFNYGFMQTTLGPGSTPNQVITAAAEAMGTKADSNAVNLQSFGGVFPRGKVMFGLARIYLDQQAATANAAGARWFVDNGVLKFVSNTGYLPGEAVVLTPATGLLGIPEATIDGIEAKCLMNGKLKVGTSVQLESAQITTTSTTAAAQAALLGPGMIPLPSRTNSFQTIARPTPGLGTYRVVVLNHTGDTRGVEWYSDIICLTIDPSAPADAAVVNS